MKKIVQYLYEYQNGIPVQNVGFVRGECHENHASLQIYGRGFPSDTGRVFEIFMVYPEEGNCVGVSMGTIKSHSPIVSYRLEYDVRDVGGKELFDRISGIVISSEQKEEKRWFGAVWEGTQTDPEQMIRHEEYEKRLLQAATLDGEEETESEVEPESEPESESEAELEPEPEIESETELDSELKTEADSNIESEPEVEVKIETEHRMESEEEMGEEVSAPKDQIFKITREDLVRLPRTEWKLANNHFLLHGYHNYHHLVSFEKEGACWLGVPGIYHPNEERVAYSFGFDQFMKPDEGEVELSAEQTEETENFGYWCRRVSSVIGE